MAHSILHLFRVRAAGSLLNTACLWETHSNCMQGSYSPSAPWFFWTRQGVYFPMSAFWNDRIPRISILRLWKKKWKYTNIQQLQISILRRKTKQPTKVYLGITEKGCWSYRREPCKNFVRRQGRGWKQERHYSHLQCLRCS